MALLPSGMGWSADENYMKLYAGRIGDRNSLTGLTPLPVAVSDSDVLTNGIFAASNGTGGSRWYRYYVAATEPGCVGGVVLGGTTKMIYAYSTNNTGRLRVVQMMSNNSGQSWSQAGTFNPLIKENSGTTGLYCAYIGFGGLNQAESGFSSANSVSDLKAMITINRDTITKANDGYAVVAWVKYKWQGGYGAIEETPILISSSIAATEFGTPLPSPATSHYLNMYYSGIIFRFSFMYSLEGATPFGIQTLDYSGSQYDEVSEQELFAMIARSTSLTVTETVDPYHDVPPSGPGGGMPNPNPQDDPIEVDPLPTLSFASAGFCRIYNPELTDLQDLADYMWTDTTFLNTVINHLKQLIENPMDAVISLSIVPCVPQRESSKTGVSVMFIPTGVSMRRVTNQFQTVDCGTVFVEEKYGSALDYNPYTKVQIYLPYIGTVPLNTDEVMNKTLSLVYHIDVVTGICCAELSADDKLLYQFSGHCSVSQPINSADFSSYLNAAIAAAKVAIAATTGAAGAMAAAGTSTTITPPPVPTNLLLPSSTELVPSRPLSDEMFNVATAKIGEPEKEGPVKSIWGELIHPDTFNTAASILGGKIDVQHSGGFSGNSGFLAKRRPYLIINRPQLVNPSQYSQFNGRPSMMYLNLGNCTGYTQVQAVHITGISATEPELSEIATLLKGGVVL